MRRLQGRRVVATALLLELALNDLLLLLVVFLIGAEDDFAIDWQSLQQKIEPVIVFVRKAHADVQPIVVLALAFDDGIRAVSWFAHL